MGLSYADLLHGPIAVVDAQTPAILLAADSGPTLDGTVDLARRVVGAGARAYGIGGGDRLAAACTRARPGRRRPAGLGAPGQPRAPTPPAAAPPTPRGPPPDP